MTTITPSKIWIVVDEDQTECGTTGGLFFEESKPEYLFFDKEIAEDFLLQCQSQNPRGCFVMLEAIKYARKNDADASVYMLEDIE